MSILSTSHSQPAQNHQLPTETQGDHADSTEKGHSGPGGDTKPESQKI